MSPSVTVRAPAKINLVLGVGPVRPDGYHPLNTVYQAVGLYDDVTVRDAAEWSVRSTATSVWVDLSAVPDDPDANIAVKAGRLLTAHHGIERAAAIEIAKGIPVAGGMAGGSADAAAALVALDRLWDLRTTDEDLLALAARLGSDVPFALLGGTAHGGGRGELVTPVKDIGEWWWVCVFSDRGLSTASVYAAFDLAYAEDCTDHADPQIPSDLFDCLGVRADPYELAVYLRNDLEEPALALRADLDATQQAVFEAGSEMALLSGSGPTMLGLCLSMDDAHEVAANLDEAGYTVIAVPGPVAGAHVVSYAT